MSAAFVVARVHLQGLGGGAMAFVWVPWPLVIQTENWRTRNTKFNFLAYVLGSCMSVLVLINNFFFTFRAFNAMAIGPLSFLWRWI